MTKRRRIIRCKERPIANLSPLADKEMANNPVATVLQVTIVPEKVRTGADPQAAIKPNVAKKV